MANRFLNNIRINDAYTFPASDGTNGQVITTDGSGNLTFADQAGGVATSALSLNVTVKNVSGGSLSKGTIVHAAPTATPPSGNVVEVIAADYDTSTSMPAIGVLNETIANEAEGEAIMFGAVSGIDTSGFSIGDELWVGNNGAFTNTKPATAGQLIQKIAVVIKSHATAGLIKVFGAGRTNDVPLPLYIDNTNQRVGIGTSSPNSKLEVVGGASHGTGFTQTRSGHPSFSLLNGGTNSVYLGIAPDGGSYNTFMQVVEDGTDINYLRFNTGAGSERMRIDSSGNVGIGNSDPQYLLHVGGAGARMRVGPYYTTGGDRDFIDLIAHGTDSKVYSNNERFHIQNDSGDIILAPSGSVGIGTTSPAASLHLGGTANQEIKIDAATISTFVGGYNNQSVIASNRSIPTGSIINSSYGASYISLVSKTDGADIRFSNSTAANVQPVEVMRITEAGDVGIGTTTPAEKLDVSGKVEADNAFIVRGIDTTNSQPSSGDAFISGYGIIGNRGTFYVTNGGGDIQIGNGSTHNASPSAYFTASSVTLTRPTTIGGNLTVSGTSGTINGNTIWHAGNDGAGSGLDADLLDGNHASAFALASHTHDDRYYTESEIQTFINRSYISKHTASSLAVGWYTIATNTGDRASARFAIWDVQGGKHQTVIFYAAHHYGTDTSNTITVLDNAYYSGNPFRYIRIKDLGTYDGAALQIYIDDASNSVNAAIVGDNVQSSGWVLKDWIADATDPGDVSNWASFTTASQVDLNLIAQGGLATTGPIYADGDTTQYKVLTTADEGSGNGLDADTLDGYQTTSSGNRFGVIPFVGTDGVMEIGKYIDFHDTDTDTSDNDYRLSSSAGSLTGSGDFSISTNNFTAGSATIGGTLTVDRVNINSTVDSAFLTGTSLLSADGYIMVKGIVNTAETGTLPAAIVFGDGSTYDLDKISLVTNGATRLFIGSSGNIDISQSLDIAGSATIGGILLEDSSDRSGLLEINQKGTTSWTGIQINRGSTLWSFMSNSTNVGVYDDTNSKWAWIAQPNAGIELLFNGAKQAETENGYFLATNQMRSPIYYDSGNTAYYVDPASTSNLNTITVNGTGSFGDKLTLSDSGFNVGDEYAVWKRTYAVNSSSPQEILNADGNSLAYGGVYRFTAHIDGTGTDQFARAVFWNENGTWRVNVTGQSGVNSNHPEFQILSNGTSNVPHIHIDHATTYNIQVFHELMALSEGSGTDNAGYAFGVDGFMGSVGTDLYFLPGGTTTVGANPYDDGNKVFHDGYHPNADKWTTARTLTLTGDVTGSVSFDGSSNITLTTTASGGGGGASSLNDLSDVTVNTTSSNLWMINTEPASYAGLRNITIGEGANDGIVDSDDIVVIGYRAGYSLPIGSDSVVIGNQAARYGCNIRSVIIGDRAGYGTSTVTPGSQSVLIGGNAGYSMTSLSAVGVGYYALQNSTGTGNVGIGVYAGASDAVSTNNVYVGRDAGRYGGTSSNQNTVIGAFAGQYMGFDNTASYNNVLIGAYAAAGGVTVGSDHIGSDNVIIGGEAMKYGNENVDQCVYVGAGAGGDLSGTNPRGSGQNCIVIGYQAQSTSNTVTNEITLGNSSISTLRCNVTSITSLSDQRDKSDIQDSNYGLNVIEKLRPVTFEWNQRDGKRVGVKEIGFIAQELQQVDDEYLNLVYDENPEKLEASQGKLIPILVKSIQELKSEIESLKKELNTLK